MSPGSLALLYGSVYAGTAVLTAGLGYGVVTRTRMESRHWFGALMGVLSAWAVVSTVGVFVSSRAVHGVLAVAWVVGALTTVFVWVVFVVHYTNGDPRESTVVRLFALAYTGLLAVAVTMPVHDIYHASTAFHTDPFPHVEMGVGPGRVAALVYTFAAVGVGVFLLWRLFVNTRYQSRRQALVLVVAVLLGIAPAVASLPGWTPVPTHNHTVIGVSGFVFVVTYAVYRHSFVDLSPVARDVAIAEMADPLFILDGEGRLVDYNDAAERTLSGLDADTVGKPASAFVPQLGDMQSSDDPSELALSVDGQQRHYSVRVSVVGSEQSPRGYVVLLRDITELRRRERELEQARQDLERSNERLDEFAGVVSHDLRNPLNVAALRLELARQEVDSEHLDGVAQAHDRMETLIDDLLTLARNGSDVDTRQEVSLREFASSCWHSVATDDATLVVDADGRVRADPDRLKQLLENLFRNAVEHGSASATVTVGVISGGFYVADDGPGIPESERETVFDRGYTSAENGTGLGLSIVRSIAEAHGWEVSVTDSAEGGARFEFRAVDTLRQAACGNCPA